jgi:hypothetical protein
MIWLFDRGGEQLRYEICRRDNGQGFLLVTTEADGKKRVEEVEQPSELIEKSVEQLKKLRADGWKIG